MPLTLLDLGPEHEVAVLEMGFYVPGEIRTLCEIAQPQVGVVNNIGTVHAERAGSQEIIAKGKAELVEALPAEPEGIAILNQDDPWVRKMAGKTRAMSCSMAVRMRLTCKQAISSPTVWTASPVPSPGRVRPTR